MTKPTKLLEELSSPNNLYIAWKELNRSNPQSFGLSGESIADYEANLDTNLEKLSSLLQLNSYQFSLTRPYLIRKDNGKFRPLQIAEVRDRVVLKGIALILERELKDLLTPGADVSFAYQEGKGIQDALFKIKHYYDKGDKFIYEADIVDFFGTVDRNNLVKRICDKLPDTSLNDLIKRGINAKVGGLESIPEQQRYLFDDKGGIPQGNALSPLFSNVYLSPFDERMKKEGFHLVRYADDFVIMCSSLEIAYKAYIDSKDFLKNTLKLDIHALSEETESKTRIIDPRKDTFSFLSVSFDGVNLFPSIKKKEEFITNILSICSTSTNESVLKVLTRVKNSHDGWISTFIFTDVKRYFEEIDCFINAGIYKYLRSVGWVFQKASLGKLPTRFRKRGDIHFESGQCLSQVQRKASGIPFSNELYELRVSSLKIRRDKVSKNKKSQ